MNEVTNGKPAILFSGGKTTIPLARTLADEFAVAVYDPEAGNVLRSDVETILSPLANVSAVARARASNAAALVTAKVVERLPGLAGTFSMDGLGVSELGEGLGGWFPGFVLAEASRLALEIQATREFLNVVDTVAVVTHEDVTPRYRALVLVARERGIPTFHVPHANHFMQVRPDLHDECCCDRILAASPWMRDFYATRGFPAERIAVVGFPPWDHWAENVRRVDKAHARTVLHLDHDRPAVTFCTTWAQSTNVVDQHEVIDEAIAAMLEAAKARGWQLIFKLHPGEPQEWRQKYAEQAKAVSVPIVITQGHLVYVLRAADAVVAISPSNVLVEAGIADNPPVVVPVRGYGFPDEPPWVAQPTAESLSQVVGALLEDRGAWDAARDAFVERYAYAVDGKATERAAEALKEAVIAS